MTNNLFGGALVLLVSISAAYIAWHSFKEAKISRAWSNLTTLSPYNTGKSEALEILADNEKNLSNINLSCTELMNNRLIVDSCGKSDGIFSYLENAKILNANLTNANFNMTLLANADFSGSDLLLAHFKKARLTNTIFKKTNISKTNFSEADLRSANFEEAKGANLSFSDAILMRSEFKKSELRGANFQNANLEGTDFQNANLESGNFQGANLSDTKFMYTRLSNVNFQGANLERTTFNGANISKADFLEVKNIDQANFANVWAWKSSPPLGDKIQEEVYLCDETDSAYKQINDIYEHGKDSQLSVFLEGCVKPVK